MRRLVYVIVMLLTASALALATPAAAAPTAGAYYVDCSAAADGTGSSASPWNSLGSVNAHTFAPGDQLLFRRGATCTGQLKPTGSGSAGAPVTAGAYGSGGVRPVIAGLGQVYAAVHLYNVEHWEVRDLEVTNTSATKAERNGVLVELEDFGTGHHYVLSGLYVHDVSGDDSKRSNGIQIRVSGTAVPTRFDDVLVENNEIHRVDREGLTTASSQMCRAVYGTGDGCGSTRNWLASTNVVFRGNLIHDIGGDGIVLRVTHRGLVERNTAYDIWMRSAGNNAGIWTINSDYPVIQYNEVSRVRRPGGNDGMAFDADFGVQNALFQYNYSHDNEGGFMLLCGKCGAGSKSTGTVVRYNVSVNDRSRVLLAAGEDGAHFHNNTFVLPSGSTSKIIEQTIAGTKVAWSNNIFANYGTGGFSYTAADHSWQHNVFHGHHASNEPADPGKITADPLLAAPATGDVHLGAGSPARKAGVRVAGNGGKDYYGGGLPQQCRPDVGAHQAEVFHDGSCAHPNLLANPGFETAALTPWTAYNSASAATGSARSGGYSARVGPAPASVEQVVAVQPNTTYVLAGWTKVSGAGNEVALGVKNHGNPEQRAPSTTDTAYQPSSVTFTTGPTATTATVYCYLRAGTGAAHCDDLHLGTA
ncbi:right-handed parallel beta-helix repeat-containing protein [Streptomyces sp. NPDC007861]|uniref:right-handed parallel beta-helix repeat-containing protein n=1 Tax=Streptomyces sp. NPDC007861 TaxID=3154893 RepID=UPI0034082E9B